MKFTKREVKSEGSGGKDYLQVKDGKSVVGVFRGEVYEFWQVWPDGGEKQVFDHAVPGASSRFKINFVTREGDKSVAKIWEFGIRIYNNLADLSQDCDLETTKIRISRRGSKTATQWTLSPVVKEPLSIGHIKAIEAVPLHILGKGATAQTDSTFEGDDSPMPSADDLPF